MDTEKMAFGHAATRLGLQWHHLDRLARRGLIPHERIGHMRFVSASDFDAIRTAAEKAGYLRREVADAAH